MSLIESFKKASTPKRVVVGSVTFLVKSWTMNERRIFNDDIERLREDEHRDENSVRILLQRSLCDDTGKLIYDDPNTIEVEHIPGDVADALITGIQGIQGFAQPGEPGPND